MRNYGLWNESTQKWVIDKDGNIRKFESPGKALEAKERYERWDSAGDIISIGILP